MTRSDITEVIDLICFFYDSRRLQAIYASTFLKARILRQLFLS
jgi:hypothetical protein